jgi:hypothetical protein
VDESHLYLQKTHARLGGSSGSGEVVDDEEDKADQQTCMVCGKTHPPSALILCNGDLTGGEAKGGSGSGSGSSSSSSSASSSASSSSATGGTGGKEKGKKDPCRRAAHYFCIGLEAVPTSDWYVGKRREARGEREVYIAGGGGGGRGTPQIIESMALLLRP